jgi:hypothetical protein
VDGSRIGAQCLTRHMADEFLAFLRKIDGEAPSALIRISSSTIRLRTRQRRRSAGSPGRNVSTSSWVNLVERLFAEITRQRIRRGVFHNVTELEDAIREWIEHRNIGRSATVSACALNVDGGDTLTVIVVATGLQR